MTAAFAGSVVFVLMAQKLVTEDHFHFIVYYVAILFLALYLGPSPFTREAGVIIFRRCFMRWQLFPLRQR